MKKYLEFLNELRKRKKKVKPFRKTFSYEILKKYSIEYVFNLIKEGKEAFIDDSLDDKYISKYHGTKRLNLRRAKVFYEKGCGCVSCDREGSYFAAGAARDNALHFDFYGVDPDGEVFGMTIDHILPRAKGGKDHISNYQPMCKECNETKGDKI